MNFWEVHSVLFVIAMAFFPRLTMLFGTAFSGGVFYYLGWFFAPRLTVAIIATVTYGSTNPVLVIFTWIWALGGETVEKVKITNSRD